MCRKSKWQETLADHRQERARSRAKKPRPNSGACSPNRFSKILDGKGSSEKLDRLVDGLRHSRPGRSSSRSISGSSAAWLTTPASSSKRSTARGKLRALAGGGRYDNLIAQLSDGAVSLPAIGFAMGDVVLGELIGEIPAARTLMEIAMRLTSANSTFTSSSRKRSAARMRSLKSSLLREPVIASIIRSHRRRSGNNSKPPSNSARGSRSCSAMNGRR